MGNLWVIEMCEGNIYGFVIKYGKIFSTNRGVGNIECGPEYETLAFNNVPQ